MFLGHVMYSFRYVLELPVSTQTEFQVLPQVPFAQALYLALIGVKIHSLKTSLPGKKIENGAENFSKPPKSSPSGAENFSK